MEQAKRVAKNTGILYARMAVTVFISLYSTRLVLDALGASDYGIYTVVGGAVVMLTFLNNAMASATQRFMSYALGEGKISKQKQIFNVSAVLHLMIGVLLIIILEAVGPLFFEYLLNIEPNRLDVAILIFHFLVISVFFSIVSVPYDAVINAHENMLFVAILSIFESIIKLSIAFLVTYTFYDKLFVYSFLMTILALLLFVVKHFYCRHKYSEVAINFKLYFSKPLFKEMTEFAGWSLMGAGGGMIGNYGKGIVLNMFFGTSLNAASGVAMQISGQLGVLSNVMLKALNPVIAKSEGAGQRITMIKASLLGIKMSFYLQMIIFIPAIIEMDFILNAWLKEPPEYAVIFTKLILILHLTDQLIVTLPSSIAAVGNIKRMQLSNFILNMLPLLIIYLFFKMGYPPQTELYVGIVFSMIKILVYVYLCNKIFNLSISEYIRDIFIRCILIATIVFFIAKIPSNFMDSSFMRLIYTFLISSTLSCLLIFRWGFNKNEETEVIKLFKHSIELIKKKYH